jgi:parvulin-like peptidyl-prolyl isomerase
VLALSTASCAATFNAGAALVNGVKIPVERVDAAVEASASQTGQPAPEGEARLAQERQQLAQLILDELLRQEAASRGIEIGPGEIDQRIDQIKQQFPSEQEFIARLQQAGFTEESLRAQIELNLAAEEIRAGLAPEVSEADLRSVYEASRERYKQARIRHILFQVPPGGDGVQQERRARATLVELQAGASFAELARERSDDPGSAENGGRLPGWTLLSALDAGFAAGAQRARIGEVTEPVRSSFGWHLILVDARRTQPFSAVRDELRQQLQDQSADAEFQQFLVTLATDADVEVNPRYGDWDPGAATIVPHQSFTPAEPNVNPLPGGGLLQPSP